MPNRPYAVGKAAVDYALKGMNAVMPVIVRTSDAPYRWKIEPAPLAKIANHEKKMPKGFITRDGFGITAAARRYLAPLIQGEAPPPYGKNGLPEYVVLKNLAVRKNCRHSVVDALKRCAFTRALGLRLPDGTRRLG
jgi:hypothetical protein